MRIGDVVWFYNYTGSGFSAPDAATVTVVHSETLVDLGSFAYGAETNVPFVQSGDLAPTDTSYAAWPR
jgi:hypothetical protein